MLTGLDIDQNPSCQSTNGKSRQETSMLLEQMVYNRTIRKPHMYTEAYTLVKQ
jgi:hypothetical protein